MGDVSYYVPNYNLLYLETIPHVLTTLILISNV